MMNLGLSPEQHAKLVFEGLEQGRFYILTDNTPPMDIPYALESRVRAILDGSGPLVPKLPPIIVEAQRRAKL